jgi:uncharacterized phage protein (TIGR02216 family)
MKRAPFPWREAMAFGFGVLRLSPQAFWNMTPRELAAAIEAVQGPAPAPMDRGVLTELMQRFLMITDNDSGARVAETLDGIEVRTQKLEVSTRRYASAVSAAFSSAITSGRSFDDVLKSLALRLSAMAVQSAMRPLAGAAMGGIFTGRGAVAAPSFLPSPSASSNPVPPAAASGAAPATPHVSINIATPDTESFRRSEAYVTGQIARAVARGQRTF